MTHQNEANDQLLISQSAVVLSIEILSRGVEKGLLKPMGQYGGLHCYQMVVDEETFLCFFPGALHYLDRFWLLLPEGLSERQRFWNGFYSLYSEEYEQLIDPSHNLICLRFFKHLIEERIKVHLSLRLLDYGCGPGFSVDVFCITGLIGYDINQNMLAQAQRRHLPVLNELEFKAMLPNSIDVCIACYVFHMAIPQEDIIHLANIVKKSGLIIANYYKGLDAERITRSFCKLGFDVEKINDEDGEFGSVYIYRKR